MISYLFTTSDLQQTFSLFKITPKFRRRSEGRIGFEEEQQQINFIHTNSVSRELGLRSQVLKPRRLTDHLLRVNISCNSRDKEITTFMDYLLTALSVQVKSSQVAIQLIY